MYIRLYLYFYLFYLYKLFPANELWLRRAIKVYLEDWHELSFIIYEKCHMCLQFTEQTFTLFFSKKTSQLEQATTVMHCKLHIALSGAICCILDLSSGQEHNDPLRIQPSLWSVPPKANKHLNYSALLCPQKESNTSVTFFSVMHRQFG